MWYVVTLEIYICNDVVVKTFKSWIHSETDCIQTQLHLLHAYDTYELV